MLASPSVTESNGKVPKPGAAVDDGRGRGLGAAAAATGVTCACKPIYGNQTLLRMIADDGGGRVGAAAAADAHDDTPAHVEGHPLHPRHRARQEVRPAVSCSLVYVCGMYPRASGGSMSGLFLHFFHSFTPSNRTSRHSASAAAQS